MWIFTQLQPLPSLFSYWLKIYSHSSQMFSHGYLSPLSSAAPLHAILPSHQLQHFCSLKSWFYTCIFLVPKTRWFTASWRMTKHPKLYCLLHQTCILVKITVEGKTHGRITSKRFFNVMTLYIKGSIRSLVMQNNNHSFTCGYSCGLVYITDSR